jgi:hypothetical protein|uniref:Uncharacterized protein n=1 Tax=viral metagenome TaxID=1070528 RepID=A0A6C0DU84_9ZZZZ
MLFRNAEGKLVEINRYDYKNDHIYYKKILQLKNLINNDAKEFNYSKILIQNIILTDSAK